MMTVKYVDKHGDEAVFPVYGVRYNDRCASSGEAGYAPAHGHVIFDRPKSYSDTPLMEHAYEGVVYVMNEAGKTVAKYDLGGQKISQNAQAAKGLAFTATLGTNQSFDPL